MSTATHSHTENDEVVDQETGEILERRRAESEDERDAADQQPVGTDLVEAPARVPVVQQTPISRLLERAADHGDLGRMLEICKQIAMTQFVPQHFRGKPADCLVAIEMGQAIGLRPLMALQLIAVINGKPALYGDGAIAIVKARGGRVFEREIRDKETNKFLGAVCVARRHGHPDVESIFTLEDAQQAGLLDNLKSTDPWRRYPRRMCKFRARGYALRDQFADWLNGVALTEDGAPDDFIDLDPDEWAPQPTGAATSAGAQAETVDAEPTVDTGPSSAQRPILTAATIRKRIKDATSVDQVNEIMDVLSHDREHFEEAEYRTLMAETRARVREISGTGA